MDRRSKIRAVYRTPENLKVSPPGVTFRCQDHFAYLCQIEPGRAMAATMSKVEIAPSGNASGSF